MPPPEVAPFLGRLPNSVVEGKIAVCYRGAILRPGVVDPLRHGGLAGVVKLADTQDLGSCGLVPWGFKSLRPHHVRPNMS
jgi:hypothetical protein